MPTTVATMANRATAGPSSPWLQQAPTAITTVAAEATRKGTECSGGPGLLAWTTRCHRVTTAPAGGRPGGEAGPPDPATGEGTARARRRPRSIRSRTSRMTWPSASTGAEHHRPAPGQVVADGAMTRSDSASAATGSAGRSSSTTTGSSVWRSVSRTISAPTWEVAGQWMDRRVSPDR